MEVEAQGDDDETGKTCQCAVEMTETLSPDRSRTESGYMLNRRFTVRTGMGLVVFVALLLWVDLMGQRSYAFARRAARYDAWLYSPHYGGDTWCQAAYSAKRGHYAAMSSAFHWTSMMPWIRMPVDRGFEVLDCLDGTGKIADQRELKLWFDRKSAKELAE